MKHMLQGWRDFLSRYLHVFRAAWSIRAQLEPPHRTTDERTFLPAHLELTETPVSLPHAGACGSLLPASS